MPGLRRGPRCAEEDAEAQGRSGRTPRLPQGLWPPLPRPGTRLVPVAPRPRGGLGWRCLGVSYQGLLLVSACSKGHHLARSRGSRQSRGHEMGLQGILGRRPPGGGSDGGRKRVMAASLSPLCVSDRGELGADCVSPAWKEALEGTGPLRLEPRESPWLIQGGRDAWAGTHGPLPWPHPRCCHRPAGLLGHMGTGIGPGRGGGHREPSL